MNDAERLAEELKSKGIHQQQVLDAIANTPREKFVEDDEQALAYLDHALPIQCGQTISQPYVVAAMTQALIADKPLNRVLEIGTGSGYQAAILSHVALEVYSIERIKTLYEIASMRLANYPSIQLKYADGNEGWDEHAPYDGIIVTAAADQVPPALLEQLADGGRLVIPVAMADYGQVLKVIIRQGNAFHSTELDAVVFVPLLSGIEK